MKDLAVRIGAFSVSAGVALVAAHAQPAGTAPPAAATDTASPQYWLGTVELPDPQVPEILVVFTLRYDAAAKAWSGVMDVPPIPGIPGASALPLTELAVDDASLRLVSPGGEGSQNVFEIELAPDRTSGKGHMVVNGVDAFRLTARKVDAGEAASLIPQRPQNPVPPLPYAATEIRFTSPIDGAELGGTITMPPGEGPFPGVVLVSDFGPHDRDRLDSLHRPFLVLADRLTRAGVAVMRTDDRGVGASAMAAYNSADFNTFAADALAGAAVLGQQKGIDPQRVGLIGLGEGAAVAALVASKQPPAFLVLLSPQGLPGTEVLVLREQRQAEAQGEDPEYTESRAKSRREALEKFASDADEAALLEALAGLMRAEMDARRGDGVTLSPAHVEMLSREQYMMLTVPRVRPWLTADPAEWYRAVSCPVLAVAGDLNLNITTADNFPKVEAALRSSASKDVTTRVLPRLNHQLQPGHTGLSDEAAQIQLTMSPEALDLIVGWVKQRAGVGGARDAGTKAAE